MIDLHTYSLINVIQWDTYFDLEEYGNVSRTLRDQKLELCCIGILNLGTNVYLFSASTCIHAHKYTLMDTFS